MWLLLVPVKTLSSMCTGGEFRERKDRPVFMQFLSPLHSSGPSKTPTGELDIRVEEKTGVRVCSSDTVYSERPRHLIRNVVVMDTCRTFRYPISISVD